MMENVTKLVAWQKSMDLVVEIYKLVKKLPKEELYGLSDQMRRAVISIPSNIAEGRNRSSAKDFQRFLYVAKGSLAELETQIFICVKLDNMEKTHTELALNLCTEIAKMLNSMISKLNNPISY